MKFNKFVITTLLLASTQAVAGNWRVQNGWCQTVSENGQVSVMLKQGQISIFGRAQGCPNGEQILLGSNIGINGNVIRTSQMCNDRTGYRPFEVEGGQDPAATKAAVLSIAGQEVSTVQVFGSAMTFTRGDMLQVCPKYVPALSHASFKTSPGKPGKINSASVLAVAKRAYLKEYGSEGAEGVDFGNYHMEGNKAVYKVFNAGLKTYDNVIVSVGEDGNAVSARVEYAGK